MAPGIAVGISNDQRFFGKIKVNINNDSIF